MANTDPRVVIVVEGGIVQAIFSDVPLNAVVADRDTQGEEEILICPLEEGYFEDVPEDIRDLTGDEFPRVWSVAKRTFVFNNDEGQSRASVKKEHYLLYSQSMGSELRAQVWTGIPYRPGDTVWIGTNWYSDSAAICHSAVEVPWKMVRR